LKSYQELLAKLEKYETEHKDDLAPWERRFLALFALIDKHGAAKDPGVPYTTKKEPD